MYCFFIVHIFIEYIPNPTLTRLMPYSGGSTTNNPVNIKLHCVFQHRCSCSPFRVASMPAVRYNLNDALPTKKWSQQLPWLCTAVLRWRLSNFRAKAWALILWRRLSNIRAIGKPQTSISHFLVRSSDKTSYTILKINVLSPNLVKSRRRELGVF